MSRLDKQTVLVLNRNWQAINTQSPRESFGQMATDVATALDITADSMIPTKWNDWLKLPIREQDDFVGTVSTKIRIPTVLVLARFARVPVRRPALGMDGIWQRDRGICQYTGRMLKRHEGNIDHVIPRSRGGDTSWENCVLADKRVNSKKGNRLPSEAGLRLLNKPQMPLDVPVTALLKNLHGIPDWDCFLIHKNNRS
ncbi:MAG: HNH endonuclease [Verrucomicrobiota bacterium]